MTPTKPVIPTPTKPVIPTPTPSPHKHFEPYHTPWSKLDDD
jgi:hypothetical protein